MANLVLLNYKENYDEFLEANERALAYVYYLDNNDEFYVKIDCVPDVLLPSYNCINQEDKEVWWSMANLLLHDLKRVNKTVQWGLLSKTKKAEWIKFAAKIIYSFIGYQHSNNIEPNVFIYNKNDWFLSFIPESFFKRDLLKDRDVPEFLKSGYLRKKYLMEKYDELGNFLVNKLLEEDMIKYIVNDYYYHILNVIKKDADFQNSGDYDLNLYKIALIPLDLQK